MFLSMHLHNLSGASTFWRPFLKSFSLLFLLYMQIFAYYRIIRILIFTWLLFSGLEIAQGLWAILLPHGLTGGALSHVSSTDDDGDDAMDGIEQGWKEEYNDLWFEFLAEKGGKGVSKDTWVMVSTKFCTTGCANFLSLMFPNSF